MAETIKEFIFGLAFGKIDPKPVTDAEKAAKEAADNVSKQWKKAGEDIKKGFGAIRSSALIVAGAATGAAAGLFKLADSAAKTGDEIAKTSAGLGVAAREVQRLRFATERSGGSTQDFTRSLKAMTLGMHDAYTKGTGPVAEGLKDLGIKIEDIANLGAEDQFAMISDALQGVGNQSERSALMMKLFGAEGGAKLKGLLDQGSAGIRALGDEAERLGLVMGDDALKASEEFADVMLDVKSTLKALVRDVGIELIPTVQAVATQIKDWTVANRQLLSTKIREFVEAISNSLRQLAPVILEILPALAKMVGHSAKLVDSIGPTGATAAVLGFKVAMSGALGPIGLVITAIATLTAGLISYASAQQEANALEFDNNFGGRGKRGEGASRNVGSAKEGRLQARQQKLALRMAEFDSDLGRLGGAEQFNRKTQHENDRRRMVSLKNEIAAERKRVDARKGRKDLSGAVGFAKNFGKGRRKSERPKGTRTEVEVEFDAEDFEFDDEFGEEIRRLGERDGVGDVALNEAIKAGGASIRSGSTMDVARQAALSRLGSASGKDYSARAGKDPLLSEIFGNDVPDVELSSLAMGAQPQTLIATINNNFHFDLDQEINGAGDPADVASHVSKAIRDVFEGSVAKSTKLAAVKWSR